MTERRTIEETLAAMHRVGRRGLTFEEVIEAGQPALYRQFGEALLFVDDTLFDVRTPSSPTKLRLAVPLQDPHIASHTVGIEYGWQHPADCSCRFCAQRDAAA